MNLPAFMALFNSRYAAPFTWGRFDCASWAFDAVQALTGTDPAADLRGQWSNGAEALRTLRRAGGWRELCDARFGREVPAALAQDGDVLLLDATACQAENFGGALAIKWGPHALAQGADGIMCVPLHHVARAWRPA